VGGWAGGFGGGVAEATGVVMVPVVSVWGVGGWVVVA